MSRYKARQSAKSVEQDFPHYVYVVVPNGGDASLPLGRARNVRLGTRCNQQLMMKIYKHHQFGLAVAGTLNLIWKIPIETVPQLKNKSVPSAGG
jgi:hypothetical protein